MALVRREQWEKAIAATRATTPPFRVFLSLRDPVCLDPNFKSLVVTFGPLFQDPAPIRPFSISFSISSLDPAKSVFQTLVTQFLYFRKLMT